MSSIHWLNLNWIDYSIIGIIALSLLIGVVRGFLCEIISLITWVAALAMAFKFALPFAAHLTFIKSPTGAYIAAFAAIFLIVLIIGITVNVMVQQIWRRTGVPVADRLLGLLLGIARGVLIIAFILLFVLNSPLKEEPVMKQSQLVPWFQPVVKWLKEILPEKVVHISEWAKDPDKE